MRTPVLFSKVCRRSESRTKPKVVLTSVVTRSLFFSSTAVHLGFAQGKALAFLDLSFANGSGNWVLMILHQHMAEMLDIGAWYTVTVGPTPTAGCRAYTKSASNIYCVPVPDSHAPVMPGCVMVPETLQQLQAHSLPAELPRKYFVDCRLFCWPVPEKEACLYRRRQQHTHIADVHNIPQKLVPACTHLLLLCCMAKLLPATQPDKPLA